MDIATLKYFIAVAQTQHMTKAARQLNITQPSLSSAIRRLESEIGFSLFDRVGRGIQLNEYGRIFLESATAVEATLSACLTEMEERRQNSLSFVRLACSISATNSQLIDLLLARDVSLKVNNIPDNWAYELANHNCDLVITMGKSHLPSIDRALLRNLKLAVMASTAHPLAALETVTMDDLRRYHFCSTSAPHSLSNIAKEEVQAHGFTPQITFLCRNSADMIKAIRTGKYLGLMGAHNRSNTGDLIFLPVEDLSITLPIYLYWRKSDTRNSHLAAVRQNILDFYLGRAFL